ncbi:helix-turn-helix transcriptional regulator [Tardiphaga alba]|uniref:Helix-turn-helix transcriptional regulator n=1 Tax=Tardiphaga alba TaxID=340268 RepID=A0ABX8A711_9BRAD|nr:helix-turn-helix transcriptional regulator [Tardiphaga alba]QUS39526.1 helix-turn-helix transcriptional regulator [Tardiphaga alba]
MDIISEIREGLRKPGKSKIGLAAALGRQPSVVTAILGEGKNGKPRQVKADEVEKIRAYFRDGEQTGTVIRPEGPEPSEVSPAPNAPRFSQFGDFDVEVKGITVGGNDDEFYFNGKVSEHVRRPPGLLHKKGVFAVEVSNDSMVPRYEVGEIVYVQEKVPASGDHVVIELYHPDDETQAGKSFVKKFERRTGRRIYCTQYNPPKEIEFDTGEVKAVYRVFPNRELFG